MGSSYKKAEESIYNKIKEYNKSASESSLRIYSLNIEKLFKDMDEEASNENHEVFEDVDKVMDLLNSQKLTTNTLKNKLSSIITFLLANGTEKAVVVKYSKEIEKLTKKLDDVKNNMEWNDKEKKNLESIESLKKYIETLKDKLPTSLNKYSEFLMYMKYLTGRFYLLFPLRNEMADMKIYYKSEYDKLKDTNNETNYIVIDPKKKSGKVILNNYKTKKSYGVIDFDIDDKDLVSLFDKYYQACKKNIENYNNYVLFKHDFKNFTRNEFTRFMNSVWAPTGKNISTSMLRKMTLSELYPVDKIKKMSHIMGHSIKTQINNYVKD